MDNRGIETLVDMGVSRELAERAVTVPGNNTLQRRLDWIFDEVNREKDGENGGDNGGDHGGGNPGWRTEEEEAAAALERRAPLLDYTQEEYMSEEQLDSADIYGLPEEIMCTVLSHLDVRTLTETIPMVSRYFYHLSVDDFLWRLICERDCGVTVQATHPVYYDQTLSWKETLWASYCPHFLATPWDVLEEHFSEQTKVALGHRRCDVPNCSTLDILICLTPGCWQAGCGRNRNGHALFHADAFRHPFNVNWRSLEVWCYACDRYVGQRSLKEKRDYARFVAIVQSPELYSHRQIVDRIEGHLFWDP